MSWVDQGDWQINADGSMARLPDLKIFAAEHGFPLISVADLVAYRLRTEQLVHRIADVRLPTESGEFRLIGYANDVDRAEHVAQVVTREALGVPSNERCGIRVGRNAWNRSRS